MIVQYQHVVTKHKLSVIFLEIAVFFLTLVEGEACWWTIHPASKQRSEGEKVRVGDDLILVSVSSERYLVRLLLVLHNDGNIYTVCLF